MMTWWLRMLDPSPSPAPAQALEGRACWGLALLGRSSSSHKPMQSLRVALMQQQLQRLRQQLLCLALLGE